MQKYVYLFSEGNADMRNLLGGKGANLAEMTNIGLPVPQGFTITTEACTKYYDDGKEISEDEYIYIGDFINDLKHGFGKLEYYENGEIYEGEFYRGEITGKGIYIWSNGEQYSVLSKDKGLILAEKNYLPTKIFFAISTILRLVCNKIDHSIRAMLIDIDDSSNTKFTVLIFLDKTDHF